MTTPGKSLFYAWQDDLPPKSNKGAIRRSLRDALSRVEESSDDMTLILDEATTRKAGAVNIPLTILEKIKAADVFVADVTPTGATKDGKRTPNPNVVFELGYAVALLGWSRIILLFNETHGEFPSDLPFDFDRHRASKFAISGEPSKQDYKALTDLLTVAIKAILEENAARPNEQASPAEIRRARDLRNLRRVMSWMHLPTIDQHIVETPHRIMGRTFHFLSGVTEVMENSLFHLSDTELSDEFTRFHQAWHDTTKHYEMYNETPSGTAYIFRNPGDLPLSADRQSIWNEIDDARIRMRKSLDKILSAIRANYHEIDIDELNSEAFRRYQHYLKEIES